jgi:hypothetical protein
MKWVVSPAVVWTDAAGEIQLYSTDTGEFQTLNATAAAIWRLLVDGKEYEAIVAGLAEECGAQDDNQRNLVASDTERFIRDLAGRGLIVAASAVTG